MRVLVLLAVSLLLLGAPCDTDLDEAIIIQIPSLCDGPGDYVLRANLGQGWFHWDEAELEAGDCIAAPPGVSTQAEACCIVPGVGENCVPVAFKDGPIEPCTRAFRLSGEPYAQDELDAWNADRAGG